MLTINVYTFSGYKIIVHLLKPEIEKMSITSNLIERIEHRREEHKNPCPNYATEMNAEKAAKKMALIAGEHFGTTNPARYVVFYIESWGRWVAAIDLTELLSRRESVGGYLGVCHPFYTF